MDNAWLFVPIRTAMPVCMGCTRFLQMGVPKFTKDLEDASEPEYGLAVIGQDRCSAPSNDLEATLGMVPGHTNIWEIMAQYMKLPSPVRHNPRLHT